MSEIVFMIAKIGGGKSLNGARFVLDELDKTDRMVVTNLPMWQGRVSAGTYEQSVRHTRWLSERGRFKETACSPDGAWLLDEHDESHISVPEWCQKYVEHPVRVGDRLRILERDEVKTFYRHYPGFDLTGGPLRGLPKVPRLRAGSAVTEISSVDELPNLAARQALQVSGQLPYGCLFVIDEVHLYFSARDWQQTGQSIEQYMSQLRKFNDDLVLITQHPEKVDKNFRRNATEWIYLNNMGKVRLWGGVSFKNRFRFAIYPVEPQKGDEPQRTGWFKLADREYHKAYDTMAGVGLAGKLLPESARAKGGHWVRWVLIMVVVLVLGCTVPLLVMKGVGRSIHAAMGAVVDGAKGSIMGVKGGIVSTVVAPKGVLVSAVVPAAPVQVVATPVLERGPQVSTNIFWGSTAVSGGRTTVFLTDGGVFVEGDGSFQFLGPNFVKIDGVIYMRETRAHQVRRLAGEGEQGVMRENVRKASANYR